MISSIIIRHGSNELLTTTIIVSVIGLILSLLAGYFGFDLLGDDNEEENKE